MARVPKSEMIQHTAELQSRDAALFIGAGMSKASGYADWTQLMKEIATELGLKIERESDLIVLAQYHVNERGGRARINRLLIEEFTKDAKLTENHHLLATLPIHTVWTTNYDDVPSRRRTDART